MRKMLRQWLLLDLRLLEPRLKILDTRLLALAVASVRSQRKVVVVGRLVALGRLLVVKSI
jgi:hypothetical protein